MIEREREKGEREKGERERVCVLEREQLATSAARSSTADCSAQPHTSKHVNLVQLECWYTYF